MSKLCIKCKHYRKQPSGFRLGEHCCHNDVVMSAHDYYECGVPCIMERSQGIVINNIPVCGPKGKLWEEKEYKTDYTPGPWEYYYVVDDGYTLITPDTEDEIAFVYKSHGQRPGESKANANLVLAAPKMIELLKEIFDKIDRDMSGITPSNWPDFYNEWHDKIHEVISEVEKEIE